MIVLKKDLWRPGPNSQPSHNCLTVCVTVHLSSGTKAWNDAAQNVGCILCAPRPNTGWQWMTNVFCVKRWTEVFEVFDPQVLLHFFHIYISIWENVCQCCLIHTRTHSHTHTFWPFFLACKCPTETNHYFGRLRCQGPKNSQGPGKCCKLSVVCGGKTTRSETHSKQNRENKSQQIWQDPDNVFAQCLMFERFLLR